MSTEPPECPVCLTPYDVVSTIPRVIPCGHTTCEACLLLLPHPFPNTIRCPSCTQLVKFPNYPSSLPKNIDLLRFSPQPTIPKTVISQHDRTNSFDGVSFIPNLWSQEFYQKWITWVLPNDIVLIDYSLKCLKGSDIDDDDSKVGSLIEPISQRKNGTLKGSDISDDLKAGSLIEPVGEEKYDIGLIDQSPIYDNETCVKVSDVDGDLKAGSFIVDEKNDSLVQKEDKKGEFMKECEDDGVVEGCSERGEIDEDSVVLDKQSLNVEGNEGVVGRSCDNDDGGIDIESLEKEYYNGKIVRGDKSVSRNYGKSLFAGMLRDGDEVGLVKVGCVYEGNKENRLKYHGEAKTINFLYEMGSDGRDELGLVLNLSLRLHRMGKVYGFCVNNDDDCVYMLCERFTSGLVEKMGCFERGSKEMVDFVMLGAEMCEIVYGLHSEGLVVGCLNVSCFGFDNFGRAYFDFGNVLMTGRRICRIIKVGIAGENLRSRLRDYVHHYGVFASPELISKMTGKKDYSEFEVCCGSDVWSLSCLLVWLLTGKSFAEEMYNYYSQILLCESRFGKEDWLALYMVWMKKVTALLDKGLDAEFVSLKKILCKCLEFDPANRPSLIELWRCIKKLVIKSEINVMETLRLRVAQESINYCIILGELCQFGHEIENCTTKSSDVHDDLISSVEHEENSNIDKDIGEGVSEGKVKCIDLKGHMDCITALTVGGGFLFSASYDKTVHVWSLEDFSRVLSLKGHEHRVMAVVYVDETSLCISGDNGGVICIWDARVPLATEPLQIFNEQKDWRYSGIHAMAVSGTQYFYTGSGDKTIKAWALQDYSLICVMSGHKSVVSSLAVNNGVLYSGSWDGTVRLWCISDHSPLAVIGEDTLSNMSSVLTLAAEHNFLFVGHEDGQVRIWQNGRLIMTKKAHNGAIFAVLKKERFLFAGGWDKTISVHEIYGDDAEMDISLVGYIPSRSTITVMAYWQGKLFTGHADKVIKMYYSSL